MAGALQDDGADGIDGGETPGAPGGLGGFFEPRPRFRRRLRGYDRTEVDDYVTWAEDELLALREGAALECSHCNDGAPPQLSAPQPAARSVAAPPVESGERDEVLLVGAMRELLRLAEQRADAVLAEAEADAERVRTGALAEAEARLHNVADLREAAATALVQARRQAADILQAAAVERARLDAEAEAERALVAAEAAEHRLREDDAARREREDAAADAADHLAGVAQEVDDLRRQRDEARESLRRLTGQIGAALAAFTGAGPDDAPLAGRRPGGVVVTGNVVLAEPREPVST